ncbi:class I SAM-dependent RNA methyltransferase [Hylemonella gracilis]|uniref:Class I SAM-dependent RNA methyltransferase n=1 Tax=Hylemonella gracilis TaxID=80880 RepID=A0A4P6UL79_9BURK|nr:THUMP domain-containing protein [Hylemonella gracilis]QBK04181.1 class I SAM-dependent RNA methyltransferase [Hylemonella gracilis]
MNDLQLFLPCAAGVEDFLATEVQAITGASGEALRKGRGGVAVRASWHDALKLNLHSRLSQRVLVQLAHRPYRDEQDIYDAASGVAWELWFTARQSFKIELTAQHSPLKSLNFATLRIKDAVADRFRDKSGARPDVDTQWPDARIHAHLTREQVTLYIDTSGEPLFKRGWREDKGEAPLKETLAAAMLAASGWGGVWNPGAARRPLYDPCCGSGTIAIEAAQIACHMAPGRLRRFGFERLLPFQAAAWQRIKAEAEAAITPLGEPLVFGSDVAHRMVDFAQRNAERAGVASAIEFRGGDALQRMPPTSQAGVLLLNPPYNERIAVAGIASSGRSGAGDGMRAARETAQTEDGGEFFSRLATHWKKNYAGWTAWVLTPDLKLPGRMRLKETRRVPLWNGPIECRLFRFDLVAGKMETASHVTDH